jgi:hypothetical protein
VAEEGRYRLAVVRDARERAERVKRGNLAAAVADTSAARARLEAAQAQTVAARETVIAALTARDTLLASGATPARLTGAEQFIARRRRELEATLGEEVRLEVALDERQSGVDVARRILIRARAERELIERHFAAWRATRAKLAERRED